MIQQSEVIEIGRMSRPHGKAGEVQLTLSNDLWDEGVSSKDELFVALNIDSILVPFHVLEWRGKGMDSVILRLRGVESEEQAARLTGKQVYLFRRDCTAADSDDELLTWQDLVGYAVTASDGQSLGIIAAVDETTINTLAELTDGTLIPLHEDLIINLDTETHALQINYSR